YPGIDLTQKHWTGQTLGTELTEQSPADSQFQLRHALYDLSQTFGESTSKVPHQIALFGMGRGAALAWQLCTLLAEEGVSDPQDARRRFTLGRDFELRFLGLFDTLG